MALIELKDVSKTYGDFKVLDGITCKIDEGKVVGILGPNRSGKTTLIKILNGMIRPSSGEILVEGNKVGLMTKKIISYLPQELFLNENYTIQMTLSYFKDLFCDFDINRAKQLLKLLKVPFNEPIYKFRGGLKQEIEFILMMSRNALIYILDEPLSLVDLNRKISLLEFGIKLLNKNSTILLFTHCTDYESILNDVLFLSEGKIVLHEGAFSLKKRYEGSITKAYNEFCNPMKVGG